MNETTHETILIAALLWARNHLDVGKPELKGEVLKRLDEVLRDYPPSIAGNRLFNTKYPRTTT